MSTLRHLASIDGDAPAGGPQPPHGRAQPSRGRHSGPRRLSTAARACYALVVGSALAAALVLVPRFHHGEAGLLTFVLFATAAAAAQLFTVDRPDGLSYKTSVVFVLPIAFLLPAEYVIPLAVVQYLPDWLRTRKPLTVQAFNMAKGVLDALAALVVFRLPWAGAGLDGGVRVAIAALAACLAYVAVNHLLLALITSLTAGTSFRESNLFSYDYLSTDLILAALGGAVAALWVENAWMVPLAALPLVLIQRTLAIPQLQAEARADAKTGLYNAGHFACIFDEELARAGRFDRPLALLMADLDYLRAINNTHGHLAGDAVLQGIADVFRAELRHYDVAGRFGGEEFSILLPETTPEQALEIAERIRAHVERTPFAARTVATPIHATLSIGIASFPQDGRDEKSLVHQADIAVYRAKTAGRNRVVAADPDQQLVPLGSPPPDDLLLPSVPAPALLAVAPSAEPEDEPETLDEHQQWAFLALPRRLQLAIAAVGTGGLAAGLAGALAAGGSFPLGLLVLAALVAGGQALSFELADYEGAISVGAVGSLAGAAIYGYRAALLLALAVAIVDWSARRTAAHHVLFNVATLSLASLGAAAVVDLATLAPGPQRLATVAVGVVAGAAYFCISMSLVSLVSALARGERPLCVFRERFSWLLQHYLVYGFVGGVMAIAYDAAGLYALAVFAAPIVLMRRTQEAYLQHTQRSTEKLREAADTIRSQNGSLELANRLLRERSNAAMESLSATVDARDSYTSGHSRRVQQLALAIGRELGLPEEELARLDRAALFHDIGKLAVPDAILLRPGTLEPDEWRLMQHHAAEGARIIERLGFLADSVPAIRHHHEHWDGSGYPSGLAGEQIPLGARIIHVADALDSMLTTRIYSAARSLEDSLQEIRRGSGMQFCLQCVAALERLLPLEEPVLEPAQLHVLAS